MKQNPESAQYLCMWVSLLASNVVPGAAGCSIRYLAMLASNASRTCVTGWGSCVSVFDSVSLEGSTIFDYCIGTVVR